MEPSLLKTAGIRWRLLARFVDMVLAIGSVYLVFLLTTPGTGSLPENLQSLALVPGFLLFGINIFLLAMRGQTVGKLLVRIQIADYYSNKLLGPFRLILLRENMLFPFLLLSFFYAWGSLLYSLSVWVDLLCGLSDDRRCLHDYVAGSHVISYDPTRTTKYGGDQINASTPRVARTEPETSWEVRQLVKRVKCIQDLAGDGEASRFAAVKLSTVGMSPKEYFDKTVQSINGFIANNQDEHNLKLANKLLSDVEESFKTLNSVD